MHSAVTVGHEEGPDRTETPAEYSAAVQVIAVAGVIVISCALMFWQLRDVFVYANDDMLQFFYAQQFGFSRELLTLNVFGHFGPVDRTGHFLLLPFGLDPLVGAMMTTALIAALLLSISWLTYEIGLSLVRRLLVLAAAGGSLAFLDNGHWADSALHVFPALTVTYIVMALHIRGIRTGARRWHVLSVVVYPLGLLTQERAAFALPLIVLIDVLLIWNSVGFRQRLRNLWSVRWPLAAMAMIGAAGALVIQRNYATTSNWPSLDTVFRTVSLAFTDYLFPQLIGYEPLPQPSVVGQVVALALIVAGCVVVMAINHRNLGPVLFLLGTFALFWGFLVFSPILIPDNIVGTAGRLGNSVYVTVPALIALASLHGPPGLSATVASWRRARPNRWLAVGCASTLVVAFSLFAMTSQISERDWAADRETNSYYRNVRASVPQWSDPSVTVIPLRGPTRIAGENGWSTSYAQHLFLLSLISPGWTIRDLTLDTVILDANGNVRPVTLETLATSPTQTRPQTPTSANSSTPAAPRICNTPSAEGDGAQVSISPPISTDGPLIARVTYTVDVPGSMTAIAFDGARYRVAPWSQPVSPGTHTTIVPVPAGPTDAIRLYGLPDGSTFCIDSLDLVRPLMVNGDGTCSVIDIYGRPTQGVPCPGNTP